MFLVLCICQLSLANLRKKSETVEFYNETKFGVDVADQMAGQCSVKAGTCQWPVAVFYNILDLAGIDAFVLYKKNQQVVRFQHDISCLSLLQNYVKTTLLKDEAKGYHC